MPIQLLHYSLGPHVNPVIIPQSLAILDDLRPTQGLAILFSCHSLVSPPYLTLLDLVHELTDNSWRHSGAEMAQQGAGHKYKYRVVQAGGLPDERV